MGSEMGNNNVSGIREEQKPAVEVAERGQEAAPADEVKAENYVILGDKGQDFNAKGEELPSDGLSASNGLETEKQESNEQVLIPEIGSQESKHEFISQDASPESNNSSCQESDVEKTDEGTHEKPLEIHDQPAIGKETETKEDESTETMSNQPSESSNCSTSSLEDSQSSLSSLINACNSEEKENAEKDFDRDENLDDFVSEETRIVENESEGNNTRAGKCYANTTEEKFGSGLEDTSDAQLLFTKNLSESCDSSSEVAFQYNSLAPSVETPEPQEMFIIHDKDNDFVSRKSEKDAKKQESTEINSTGEAPNELIINNPAPAVTLHDASCKENEEEVLVKMTSTSSFEKVCPNEKLKVSHKRSKSVVAGNKKCASIDQFEDIEEDIKKLLTFASVSILPSSTDKNNEKVKAKGKASINETDNREKFPSSMAMNNGDQITSEEDRSGSESCNRESSLLDTSSGLQLSSQNDNATVLITDAAEDGKKVASIDQQDHFVNEKSNLDAYKETMDTLDSSIITVESFKPGSNIQIQTTSGTSADTEVLCNWSNQQFPSGQTPDLPIEKALENSVRVVGMTIKESNPGQHAGNQVQRSKSPSFDFGLTLDAKSEDSDQTPLLHQDNKTAARSFSGFANVRFQNRIIQTDYGRKSLDFEPVGVEEKTIRMERSDSDISRASFMNLLKKDDEKGSNVPLFPKKQESPTASNHSEELSTEEDALNSVKGSGKQRKIKNSKASIFTSCICCTAIH